MEHHTDDFLTIADLEEPCCGPHLLGPSGRVIVSFCEERGWRVFLDQRLLFRIVTDDTDFETALGSVDPTVETEEDAEEEPTIEAGLMFAVLEAIEQYVATVPDIRPDAADSP